MANDPDWRRREKLVEVYIANCFEKVSKLLPPGSLLTFVMRNPGRGDHCNMIVTEDSLSEVAHVLFRRNIEIPEDIESNGGRI